MSAPEKMKGGKTAGLDGTVVEMLKNGGINVIDWLLRIFNRCMEAESMTEKWKRGVCKLQGNHYNAWEYMYGRVLIGRVVEKFR